MLVRICIIFFIAPLKELWRAIFEYIAYLYRFSINALLCKDVLNKSIDDIALEAFKIFKFLVFCILSNITINDILFDRNSNLLNEIKSESSYLLFFILSFLLCYYLAAIYSTLRKNEYLKVVIARDWLLTMMITTIIFQLTGVLNPSGSSEAEIEDIITSDLAGLAFSYLALFLFQFYRMIRARLIRWYDFFFCLVSFSLYIFLLICKGVVIQLLIS